MKLINKKTGEHGEYQVVSAGYLIRVRDLASNESWQYDCLAGFNENWEDYMPTEPLIKDEKIRKAVRAWAVANRVAEARYSSCHDAECEFNARDDENKLIVFIGNFQEMNERLDITGRTIYTIAELCGSEE